MKLDFERAGRLLKDFELRKLFIEEVGWDRPGGRESAVTVAGIDYTLVPIAEKRSVQILQCVSGESGFPGYATRQKIERHVRRLAHEHLIVFTDEGMTRQVWQWASRSPGGPMVYREHEYRQGQSPLALVQKLAPITFVIDDEEGLTLLDVTNPLKLAFDKEAVTKRFYDRFKTEQRAFLEQIAGIEGEGAEENRHWYASLMLNRLMFVYFIQKKGFLDGDVDYLRNRLNRVNSVLGGGHFLTFYRSFLLRLFHEGLGAQGRNDDLTALIGSVPYLNGGLFDVHELEERYTGIDIPDEAFARVFDFFDAYQWHLDERAVSEGNEINPDVLGYIFEKYINQKQMGAYYTKEDVTEFMARNAIVPVLIDGIADKCAMEPVAYSWTLLSREPDRYIPRSMLVGVDDDTHQTLPTESPLEAAHRRERVASLRRRIATGEFVTADQLVTANLESRQFLQDMIEQSEGPELVRAAFESITSLTVLDPTCGSGAFLFAALNILQPLYEACLNRMQAFVDESADSTGFSDFRSVLGEADSHPNRTYFVMKRIVLRNLHGVDLMDEAVEICKLRLFLKLVSQVETVEQMEPLPDIDFNIQHGNTLVGYTTMVQVEQAVSSKLDFDDSLGKITTAAAEAQAAYYRFRDAQDAADAGAGDVHELKRLLKSKLDLLRDNLDSYLAGDCGVTDAGVFRERYTPFHWLIQFHDTITRGGFDVVIGNPPYISMSKLRKDYSPKGYKTGDCTDVYALVLERCAQLLRPGGRTAMIVPLSLAFSGDFEVLRSLLREEYSVNWFSSFARIPAALFSADVRVRNTIHIGKRRDGEQSVEGWTTVIHRWFEQYRPHLFGCIEYASFIPNALVEGIPRFNTTRLGTAFEGLASRHRARVGSSLGSRRSSFPLHFKQAAYNWLAFSREQPPCFDAQGRACPQSKVLTLHFQDEATREMALLLLNGKVEFAFWCIVGDDFDVTKRMVTELPVDILSVPADVRARLMPLVTELDAAMERNVSYKLNAGKNVGNYNLARCRSVTDRSDRIFAEWLGLDGVWDDIELMYAQVVKTQFEDFDAAG